MYFKVIQSGHIFEVYQYPVPPSGVDDLTGKRILNKDTSNHDPEWEYYSDVEMSDEEEEQLFERPYSRRRSNITSSRNQIRRIVSANFDIGDIFVTCTFRENITDREYAIKEWDKFMKRLKRRCGSLKYLTVVEYQKRGAVHFHSVMSMEKPYTALGTLWKHGWVQWDFIKNKKEEDKPIDNIGAYMIKYLMKDIKNADQSTKSYFASRNLIRPVEYRGVDALDIISNYCLDTLIPVYTHTYGMSVLHQQEIQEVEVKYMEFNMKREVEYGRGKIVGGVGKFDQTVSFDQFYNSVRDYLCSIHGKYDTLMEDIPYTTE